MKLTKVIYSFFATIIIGIEIDNKFCYITVKTYKRGKLIDSYTKEFKTDLGELPISAINFINKIQSKKPFTYITTLSSSIVQGIIHAQNQSQFIKYGVNVKEVEARKIDNWFVYVSKEDILETKKKFSKVGVDFIISPFLILYTLTKDFIKDNKGSCKLYLLFQKSNITMIVATGDCKVLFGAYYVLESGIDAVINTIKDPLSHDLEGMERVEIVKDIEDRLTSFSESEDELDDELIKSLKGDTKEESHAPAKQQSFDDFMRISYAVRAIQSAISEFYNNEIYDREFIHGIVIFNPHKIEEEVLMHIQNTMMLDIEIVPTNVSEIVADLGYESYLFCQERKVV
ncbi:MAG: hypothetical protein K2I63_02500 [Helicobacter sp.]|nr:hypothetical protein [Helicobacter sp.]